MLTYSEPFITTPDHPYPVLVAGAPIRSGDLCSVGVGGRVWPDYIPGAVMGFTDRAYQAGELVTLYANIHIDSQPPPSYLPEAPRVSLNVAGTFGPTADATEKIERFISLNRAALRRTRGQS